MRVGVAVRLGGGGGVVSFFFFQAEDGIRGGLVTGVETYALPICEHSVVIAQVGISGSTTIGSRVILAGQAGLAGHLKVGDGSIVGAQAGVMKDVDPKSFVIGSPAMPHLQFKKMVANTILRSEERSVGKECRPRWSPYH